MKTSIYKNFCLTLATWKRKPSSLVARIQAAHEPIDTKLNKHNLRDGAMYFTRMWFRPITMYCLRTAYKDTGYKPIGYGYFSVVLLKNNKVYKCLEFTTSCSDADRQALLRALRQRLDLAEKYFGAHYAKTKVSIEKHLVRGVDCVVLSQDYIEGNPLHKRPYSRHLSDPAKQELHDLLLRAKKMLNEKGFLLDVYYHNLMEVNDKIVVVDTVPMSEIDMKTRPLILKMLNKELKLLEN